MWGWGVEVGMGCGELRGWGGHLEGMGVECVGVGLGKWRLGAGVGMWGAGGFEVGARRICV